LLLFTGITLILGVSRTLQFFNPFIAKRSASKIRGTVCIAIGMAMLLLRRGWSSIAFFIECAWRRRADPAAAAAARRPPPAARLTRPPTRAPGSVRPD
jgi:hypothetical protein